jgi:hypothetical protein
MICQVRPRRSLLLNPQSRLSGGRTWWAHFAFTRIDTTPTILRKKIEDLRIFHTF